MQERRPTIALAGASGSVGGRLLERLEAGGFPVRCLARRPEYLAGRVGRKTTVVRGDCLVAQTLEPLLRDVDCAFYLVHSMGSNRDFARVASKAGVRFAGMLRGIASCPSSNLNPSRAPVRTGSLKGATSASGSTNE